jgi:FkbM family methyltransferase
MALAGASDVRAFEPAPLNQQAVRRVMALNPGLPIKLVEAAVGAEEGSIKITIHEDSSMNFIGEDASGRPAVEVKMVVLDSLLATGAIKVPQLLKVDVEGAELRRPCANRCGKFSSSCITTRQGGTANRY